MAAPPYFKYFERRYSHDGYVLCTESYSWYYEVR